eukprot:2186044-Prymnesium_polylepis.1
MIKPRLQDFAEITACGVPGGLTLRDSAEVTRTEISRARRTRKSQTHGRKSTIVILTATSPHTNSG